MGRKPRFRLKVTKIKLNPEQAVLDCTCFNNGVVGSNMPNMYYRATGQYACYRSARSTKPIVEYTGNSSDRDVGFDRSASSSAVS